MDSAGGVLLAANTFGANGLLSRRTSSGSTFYTFDPQGSVAQRFGPTANLLSSDEYDAYGALQGTTQTGARDGFGYGAQWGYQTDNETGLLLLTNRYYDPATGRFLTPDPLGRGGGANLYRFVGNNPLVYADPLGLFSVADAYVYGAGLVGGIGGFFSGGGPLGAAIGAGLGIGLASQGVGASPGEGLTAGVGTACDVATLGEFAGAAGSVLPEGAHLSLEGYEADEVTVGLPASQPDFDEARREAFERAGMTDPADVEFSKVDPETGTVVEFKGPGGAKVAYDAPHASPGAGHDMPHVGWQTGGKRGLGMQRGNIPYRGPQHPFRSPNKGEGLLGE